MFNGGVESSDESVSSALAASSREPRFKGLCDLPRGWSPAGACLELDVEGAEETEGDIVTVGAEVGFLGDNVGFREGGNVGF